MTQIDFDAVEHHLSLVTSDPALLASFRARYPSLITVCRDLVAEATADNTPKPFPPISQMTAIQTAIFDNWPDGKRTKNHPNRYGMAIEVWTDPAQRINVTKRNSYQFKGNVRLLDAKELGKRIDGLQSPKLRNPISAAYAAELADMKQLMKDGHYVGLIATKTPEDGTFYHDRQFVYVVLDGADTRCIVSIDGEMKLLPTFSANQPNGSSLTGVNVILQSRYDACGFSTTWATEDFAED